MVNKSDYGAVYKYAPDALRTRWTQKAFKKTHEDWSKNRLNEYQGMQSITRNDGLVSVWMVFTIDNYPSGVGNYGRDEGFEIEYSLNRHHLVDRNIESESLRRFGDDLVENIHESIDEECPSMLSKKEFMVYTSYRTGTEREVADAFSIDIGTVRGKVGRVRDKISSAENLVNFTKSMEKYERIDEQKMLITPETAEMVSDEELPITTTSSGQKTVPIPLKEYVNEDFNGDKIRNLERRYYNS